MNTLARRATWMLVAAGSAMAAGAVVRGSLRRGWQVITDEEPPADLTRSDTSWPKALAWTAATGVAAALAELVARRGAEVGWRMLTGRKPPRRRRR